MGCTHALTILQSRLRSQPRGHTTSQWQNNYLSMLLIDVVAAWFNIQIKKDFQFAREASLRMHHGSWIIKFSLVDKLQFISNISVNPIHVVGHFLWHFLSYFSIYAVKRPRYHVIKIKSADITAWQKSTSMWNDSRINLALNWQKLLLWNNGKCLCNEVASVGSEVCESLKVQNLCNHALLCVGN